MTMPSADRLLLVDDETEIVSEIAAYLRRRGFNVTTASCCEEADRMLNDRDRSFDVLVSDVRMPDGSGIELCRTFMKRPGGSNACILVTGHLELCDLSPDLLKSGLSIVYKPFSPAALCAKIREIRAAMSISRQDHESVEAADAAARNDVA
jgi:DNA-binding response OmpR family regulator